MRVNGSTHTTIWYDSNEHCVRIIDQTKLPHRFEIVSLRTLDEFCQAIKTMQVRGAPLIGITAAFGMAMALSDNHCKEHLQSVAKQLMATRPTAINLAWAINRVKAAIAKAPLNNCATTALAEAECMRLEDIASCATIGKQGERVLEAMYKSRSVQGTVNVLTHCNAGWLATVDWGTALSPIYQAHQSGVPIHVWVDETRPRNQGASLTAWELSQQGIPHTIISDNTGGHLMQHGMVDLCLVGSDRTSSNGDVCNKIGTYLKALAAYDNHIPFYVALPSSTIDWTLTDGVTQIPIEERNSREVTHISGLDTDGHLTEVKLVADSSAANYAFDVTPARLVTGLITEHGIFDANTEALKTLRAKLGN